MIDSIRKSLSIDSMDDIKLLVDTFYEFGPKKKERLAEEEKTRQAAREAAALAAGAPLTGEKDQLQGTKKPKKDKEGDQLAATKKPKEEP